MCLSYILVMIFFSNFPQSVFGSIKRLAFSSDEMSIARNPSQSVFIIVSLIDLLRMYFCRFIPADTLRNNDVVVTSKRRHFDVITSKWRRFDVITTLLLRHVFRGIVFSDIPRLTIHDSIWRTKRTCVFIRSFREYLIGGLHIGQANLVGKFIFGRKLFVHIKSKNLPNLSRSECFNKFISKSLTIASYVFSPWSIFITRHKLYHNNHRRRHHHHHHHHHHHYHHHHKHRHHHHYHYLITIAIIIVIIILIIILSVLLLSWS